MADIGQACTIKLDLSVRTIVRSQRLALPQLGYRVLAKAELDNISSVCSSNSGGRAAILRGSVGPRATRRRR